MKEIKMELRNGEQIRFGGQVEKVKVWFNEEMLNALKAFLSAKEINLDKSVKQDIELIFLMLKEMKEGTTNIAYQPTAFTANRITPEFHDLECKGNLINDLSSINYLDRINDEIVTVNGLIKNDESVKLLFFYNDNDGSSMIEMQQVVVMINKGVNMPDYSGRGFLLNLIDNSYLVNYDCDQGVMELSMKQVDVK